MKSDSNTLGQRINDSATARWTVLFIVATTMMMGYFVNDVMSPLETLLEMPQSEGGLGWTSTDYGFFSGSSGFINVFLLMLFFSGIILDKMGIRFTGTLATTLMVAGCLIKYYAVTASFGTSCCHLSIADYHWNLPMSAAVASLGFAVFGVGYEMTGIAVSKAMVRWFTGHELALAMGIQVAMARLGTATALSISAPIARHFSLSAPLLLATGLLIVGLLVFLVFRVMDRQMDDGTSSSETSKASDEEFCWSDISATLRSSGFWLITLFCVLFYSAVSPFLKFSTKLMVVKYGVDADIAGIFSSIAPFGTILLTPLFGYVYDRYGRGVTLIISGALMLTLVHFGFAIPLPSSTLHLQWVAILLMVVLSISYSLAPAALWPCVPKIIPMKCLGTAYSMIFFIQNFGRAIIPMFVGRANQTDPSYTTSMLIFGCTALGATIVAITMLYINKVKDYKLQQPNIKK